MSIDKNDHWFLSLPLFCPELHLLICLDWSNLAFLKWNQIGHGVWSYLSMVFFKVEEFYCENLHLFSSKKFTSSFLCLVFSISYFFFSIFHFRVMPLVILCVLLDSLRSIGISSSLNAYNNSVLNASGLASFFTEKLFITALMLWNIGLTM